MNELDISNTQAVFVTVILIGLLLYLNHLDRPQKKRPTGARKPTDDRNT